MNVDLFVLETGDRLVTSAATLVLADAGNPLGDIQSRNLSGNQTWNKNQVAFFTTNPSNLTLLPFQTQFTLTWDGSIAKGGKLADGTYTLCLNVIDGDGNNSSSAANLCDNSISFTVDWTPLTVMPRRRAHA